MKQHFEMLFKKDVLTLQSVNEDGTTLTLRKKKEKKKWTCLRRDKSVEQEA